MKIIRNILLLVLALFVGAAFGQTVTSPDGNPVLSVAIANNGTMYSLTKALRFNTVNIYKSTDNGQNWINISLSNIYSDPVGITTVYDTLKAVALSGDIYTYDNTTASWGTGPFPQTGFGSLGSAFAVSAYGDTMVVSGSYAYDNAGLSYSFDGGYTFKIDTTLDSLIYYHYTQTGTGSGFIGSAMTSTGFYDAIQSGVFFSPMDSLLHSWDLLPLDTVFLKSKQPYISNGDTLAIAGVQKLVSVNDSVFVFLDVDTLHTATYGNMKTTSNLVPGGSGTLVWAITSPDSIGVPVNSSRFPDSTSAVASLKTSATTSMHKGQYGVSSYSYNSTVVFGTSSGKVIVERSVVTGIESPPIQQPASFTLSQNYPNPFNPTTQVNYSIPKSGTVSVVVYNTLGQRVATLFSGRASAGEHTVTFNADRFASGVYFCRMEAGGFSKTVKMMLLK